MITVEVFVLLKPKPADAITQNQADQRNYLSALNVKVAAQCKRFHRNLTKASSKVYVLKLEIKLLT